METQLRLAITNNDAISLNKYIILLDQFHRGDVTADQYPGIDSISDDLYETAKRKYETLRGHVINKLQQMSRKTPVEEIARVPISDLAMTKDGIIKDCVVNITSQTVYCIPKYDGISCAIRFIWDPTTSAFIIDDARTRGADVGVGHKDTNMKDLIKQVLESPRCPWYPERLNKFGRMFKQITVRGELVVTDSSIPCPAPYVAGKVNSARVGAKTSNIDPDGVMTYKIFEITRVVKQDGESGVPKQLKALKYIHLLDSSIPYEEVVLTDNTDDNTKKVLDLYKKWCDELNTPIDGVVYSSSDWTYPFYQDETHGVNYGKYALKPNEMSVSQITGVEYTMAKDGKLNPILKFKPITICGKTYKQAKSAITNLVNFINNSRMGEGSTIDVTLQSSIIPQVTKVIPDDKITPFKLPDKCPICGSNLEFKQNKSISTLTCTNDNCRGRVIKLLINLMKNLHVPGLAEKNLNKMLDLVDGDYMKLFKTIDDKNGEDFMKNKIYETTVGNLMIGLGLATKTTLKKSYVKDIASNIVRDELIAVRHELTMKSNVLVKMVLAVI